ncbi:hypothetical protein KJ909_01315 [Patescibacteria group bacterium]|nr:hypothetical protein [Patescibacteria group bacterium]
MLITKTKKIFWIATAFSLAMTLLLFPITARAQSALGLSAIPPRLEITLNPGEVKTAQIKVKNESTVDQTITTSATDFIVTDDEGTPVQIDTDMSENRWAGSSWIQISPTVNDIKAGQTKSLTVTVLAPDDALPGGHYAMILHSPNTSTVLDSTGAAIQTNVGTLVYITIPGDIKENAQVKKFTAPRFSEFGPINFETIIANFSDIHISPIGAINIKNWLGGTTANLTLDKTNIFPYTSRTFENTLNRKWLFGRYRAQVNAGYGTAGQIVSATIFFWVIPWRLIVLILATAAITFVLIKLLKKKKTVIGNE